MRWGIKFINFFKITIEKGKNSAIIKSKVKDSQS